MEALADLAHKRFFRNTKSTLEVPTGPIETFLRIKRIYLRSTQSTHPCLVQSYSLLDDGIVLHHQSRKSLLSLKLEQ